MTTLPTAHEPQDIDVRRFLGVARRFGPRVLLAALGLGAVTYALQNARPREYEAVASLAALQPGTGSDVVNNALVPAPPLPQNVVERAAHGRSVVTRTIREVSASSLPANLKDAIVGDLRGELARNRFGRVRVSGNVDYQSTGLYELRARAETPEAARVLANAAMEGLLAWDRTRSVERVRRASDSLNAELRALDARAVRTTGEARAALAQSRADLTARLAQVSVLEQAVLGTLTPVSQAEAPLDPVSPQPLRNALIVVLGTLFFGLLGGLLADALTKRVTSVSDARELGLPVLGTLPRMRRSVGDLLRLVESGPLFEAVEFLRVNLLGRLNGRGPLILAISSARPGEGKSHVTAALAASLAANGRRVLLVDADVYRPTQERLWPTNAPGARAYESSGLRWWSGVRTRVDLAVPVTNELNAAHLVPILRQVAHEYDIVLVDTPPILAIAESLALAAPLDGLVMVVESGQTPAATVDRALEGARQAGVEILGLVLNRVSRGEQPILDYGYRPPVRS